MTKKKLLILLTIGIWLANYLICFCDCEDDLKLAPQSFSSYFLDNHSDKESDPCSKDLHSCCANCCGNQVFFPIPIKNALLTKSPTLLFNTLNPFFSGQLYLSSVFHPPKA